MAGLLSLQQKILVPALPISSAQFAKALLRIWQPSISRKNGREIPTIGLAISGGVDSMALALLCSRLKSMKKGDEDHEHATLLPHLKFRAFVVDHGVRSGSQNEAKSVAAVLEHNAIGIPTTILDMNWPHGQSPSELSNFETQARRNRFQLLGRACKEHGIDSLLLAHHQDDQAETVLMRLVKGHRGSGLSGIKCQSVIPECYGIHGVHESGGIDKGALHNVDSTCPYNSPSTQPVSESGGIRIYRPLLDFGKSNLISTCQTSKTPWFEDHTNMDPTITERNAVRYLFANHSLPAALSKPRLLALARRSSQILGNRKEQLRAWLAHCIIIDFNTAAGTLTVDIPELAFLEALPGKLPEKTGVLKAHFLRELVKLVSPYEHQEIRTLYRAAVLLFLTRSGGIHKAQKSFGFTVAGVQFQPRPDIPIEISSVSSTTAPKVQRWFLSRQPYRKSGEIPSLVFPSNGGTWSSWILYDGRFWIRVQNSTSTDLVVRPLSESDEKDLQRFLRSYPGGQKVLESIKQAAPGIVRRTLPVLLPADGDIGSIGIYVLGFHTIPVEAGLKWEIRYKKVYTENFNFQPLEDASSKGV